MNNLSPSAQQLVRAGARAARPSEADRARLLEAMRARLGDGAVLGAASVTVSQGVTRAVWVKVSAATVGLGLLVGGAVALQPAPQAPVISASVRPSSSERRAPVVSPIAEAPALLSPVSPASPSAPLNAPAGSANRRAPDRLAQEVALLSRATSALRSGRASDALTLLNEHQSQFPKGVLAEERRAARAQALCALGRRSEAEADLARLARTAPQSPQAARARQACSSSR